MAKGKDSGFQASMKALGRNLARANLQTKGGYKEGGGVKMPSAKAMGSFGGSGMEPKPTGGGTARGGKASRGMKFSGSY